MRAILSHEPYASRCTFALHGFESPEGLHAQQIYCFGADRHGLVVLGPDGSLRVCRPGHFYGEGEIRSDLDRWLRPTDAAR